MAIEELHLSLDAFEFERIKGHLKQYIIDRYPEHAECNEVAIRKKSMDARSRNIVVHLRLNIYTGTDHAPEISLPAFPSSTSDLRVFVVGFGPAGIFACFKLLESGIRPVVIERGKAVSDRRRDVAKLNRGEEIDPESNYCFGEGGAGTFSDGKLYTRSTKRGPLHEVLENFVYHGADPSILYEAHPHIGTNKLPGIIERMRQTLVNEGVDIRFSSKMTDLEIVDGRINGIEVNGQKERCDRVILATGHSARDVFELLNRRNNAYLLRRH